MMVAKWMPKIAHQISSCTALLYLFAKRQTRATIALIALSPFAIRRLSCLYTLSTHIIMPYRPVTRLCLYNE